MKSTVAITALALALMSSQACADEHRGGDAALGALSGAVVFGPIGAIAGAAVGYAAGPSIAHSWGFRRSQPAVQRARPARAAAQAADRRPAVQSSGPPASQAAAARVPPVQTFE